MNHTILYHWINSEQQLATICQHIATKSIITLDTEFIRTRSYYPKLGLIQLCDGEETYLIDPISIRDFTPFVSLLSNSKILKVLHACSEDLEVFQHYFQQLPQPMLDTQIMAAFMGLGISVGFAKLVEHYLGIALDKGAARTDWLARPLSETQCQYAAADAHYLFSVFTKLSADLAKTPWQQAVLEESQLLLEKRQQPLCLETAYKDIANAWQLLPSQLATLKLLAKWRIEEARKRDLALNFIVKEQHLWQIAKIQPKHTSTLLSFMHPNEVRIHGKKLLWLVEQARAIAPEQYPKPITRLVDEVGYKHQLKVLQQTLQTLQPQGLPIELVASKRQLNQLIKWQRSGRDPEKLPELLKGWRTEIGKQLLAQCDQ